MEKVFLKAANFELKRKNDTPLHVVVKVLGTKVSHGSKELEPVVLLRTQRCRESFECGGRHAVLVMRKNENKRLVLA